MTGVTTRGVTPGEGDSDGPAGGRAVATPRGYQSSLSNTATVSSSSMIANFN